jgi:hypothetical protein
MTHSADFLFVMTWFWIYFGGVWGAYDKRLGVMSSLVWPVNLGRALGGYVKEYNLRPLLEDKP